MTEKEAIRKQYKQLRDGLSKQQVEEWSAQIAQQLLSCAAFREADYVYAYYPLGNEADVRLAVTEAFAQGKRVAFPKVFHETMQYFEVTSLSQFEKGSFCIMEPIEDHPVDWREEESLLVLTPGVAFDKSGNRLGFGKGYYDRHFADVAKITMAGIGYSLQFAEQLPADPRDVPLQILISEKEVLFKVNNR